MLTAPTSQAGTSAQSSGTNRCQQPWPSAGVSHDTLQPCACGLNICTTVTQPLSHKLRPAANKLFPTLLCNITYVGAGEARGSQPTWKHPRGIYTPVSTPEPMSSSSIPKLEAAATQRDARLRTGSAKMDTTAVAIQLDTETHKIATYFSHIDADNSLQRMYIRHKGKQPRLIDTHRPQATKTYCKGVNRHMTTPPSKERTTVVLAGP